MVVAALHFEGLLAVAVIAALAVVYGRAFEAAAPPASPRRAIGLCAGLLAVGAALVGPLEQAAHTSFSAHMAQHLLLGVVAPPLLLVGRPAQILGRGLRRRLRVQAGRWYGRGLRACRGRAWLPVAALLSYAVVWWGWHLPPAYTAALQSTALHVAEHATMLGAGLALWAPVLRPRATPPWLGPLLLLGASIQGGVLAAVLTFAAAPWYPTLEVAAGGPAAALADQQAGGAMMWVGGGLVYMAAAAVAVAVAIRRDERTQARLTAGVVDAR